MMHEQRDDENEIVDIHEKARYSTQKLYVLIFDDLFIPESIDY